MKSKLMFNFKSVNIDNNSIGKQEHSLFSQGLTHASNISICNVCHHVTPKPFMLDSSKQGITLIRL